MLADSPSAFGVGRRIGIWFIRGGKSPFHLVKEGVVLNMFVMVATRGFDERFLLDTPV